MITLHASALPRILACLGSVALAQAVLEQTRDLTESESAREGTAAHYVAEQLLRGVAPDQVALGTLAPNGVPIDAEMIEHARTYAEGCTRDATAADASWLEVNAAWLATPSIKIGCKIDAAWRIGDTLYVRDFKYGWRLVDPVGNWQLLSYAVGLVRELFTSGGYAPPQRFVLSIYQPRPYHPDGPLREYVVTLDELIAAHDELVAALGMLPTDALATGEHCEYCPAGAAGACPAYLAAVSNAIDVATRGTAATLAPVALAKELVTLQRAAAVLDQRREWVQDIIKRTLKTEPAAVPGWKLEPQKANTTWTIEPEALARLTNADIYKPRQLVTPAEAKRRGVSEEIITANTTRPIIGEKLVRYDPDAEARKALAKTKGKKTK